MLKVSTEFMKKIINTAHFGKLLHTSDNIQKYGFNNIAKTMSKVKEITLAGEYLNITNMKKRI